VNIGPPGNLTYSTNNTVYILGCTIHPNTPTYSGIVDTWSINPELPAGLNFDTSTGIISGAPEVESPETIYTVTASNTTGYTDIDLKIIATSETFNMIYIPASKFFIGTEDDNSADIQYAYFIGETEVTYKLWYTVYMWSISNGYIYNFSVFPREGNYGNEQLCMLPFGNEPVTYINWYHVIVWTNALTEYYNNFNNTNFKCVYFENGYIIKDVTQLTSYSDITADQGANGFRLPTSLEWELAARYINDNNNDGDIMDPGEYYYGYSVSGSISIERNSIEAVAHFAPEEYLYTTRTLDVKSKLPNALGIYDMSGNVEEMVFDNWPNRWTDGTRPYLIKGGCCNIYYRTIGGYKYNNAEDQNEKRTTTRGFRIARNYN
jgi:hypothetical protein